ncbi:pseudouridine synthase [Schleiferilactobacillus shenzhenensis]|uniref:Pseudouridine synthase n=1 Tax=Schleiferilactobacillus shenzhenensis LY-73 TaxID=1231336 RepID=U4TZ19_9LACO|nr:pseudouridine synthase [Schleiferilactobacillus shenzhenensis]ERL66562.1 RluB [Schleiferilactobacillus shenzhenensis LY-73]
MSERLQKAIANAGVASRRKAEKLIAAGHVTVNGETVTAMGVQVTPQDAVEVDGVPLTTEQKVYYLLYKPRGVVTTAHDDKGRKTVVDLLTGVTERVYPVGRLDYDASGLLLLTNDGELANGLMHPSFQIDKTYVARVKGIPVGEQLKRLEKGIVLDGKKTRPAKVKVIRTEQAKNYSIIQITIHEGWHHQVKRMFAAVGLPVDKLSREKYAFLDLSGLSAGEYRSLRTHEVRGLYDLLETRGESVDN